MQYYAVFPLSFWFIDCPATGQDNRLNQVSDQKRRIKMQVPCVLFVIERVSYAEFTKVSFHFTCICFSWVDTWFFSEDFGVGASESNGHKNEMESTFEYHESSLNQAKPFDPHH